jgi:peroxiredoxin
MPCRSELPTLDKLYREWRSKGLLVLGISDDDPEALKKLYEKEGLGFPTVLDPAGGVRAHYGRQGIPFTVVLDRKGRVVAEFLGVRREAELLALRKRAGLK